MRCQLFVLLSLLVSAFAQPYYSTPAAGQCPSNFAVWPQVNGNYIVSSCSSSATCGSTCTWTYQYTCNTYGCTGSQYRGGANCATIITPGPPPPPDACALKGCAHGVGCVDSATATNGAICQCEDKTGSNYVDNGWIGDLCNIAINNCQYDPLSQWQQLLPSGTSYPCGTYGTCVTVTNWAYCQCSASQGYSGIYCLTPSAPLVAGTWQQLLLAQLNLVRANIAAHTNNNQPNAATLFNLVWDANLALHAQRWAQPGQVATCTNNAFGFTHSPVAYRTSIGQLAQYSYIGENLFADTESYVDGVAAVNAWFAEQAAYNLASNTCTPTSTISSCGHYTQVVWASTWAVGCASLSYPCGGFTWQVVACQFGVGGNVVGQSPYTATTGATTVVTH